MLGPMAPGPRQYRIVGLLGRGGYGSVYLADFDGGGGFSRRVAIKLLSVGDKEEDALSRLRDEARILGLLDDRAVVTVEPPTRLDGQPAVVMDYVEGVSARRLLKKLGPLPPTAAIEIVREVARVLDKAWTTRGPDGQALQLVHRDIKPDNLQITAHGELRLLDFGIAKAKFRGRESKTTAHLYGTTGYMAPERFLYKKDSPAGDIFSLGVVLYELLTGEKAAPYDDGTTEPIDPAIALALRMAALEPKGRPTAREVEDECGQLLRRLEGPSLRRWAEGAVPDLIHVRTDDPLIGKLVTEGDGPGLAPTEHGAVEPTGTHSQTLTRRRGLVLLTGSTFVAVLLAIAVGVVLVGGGVGAWYAFTGERSSDRPELPVEAPEPEPEPEPEPQAAPAPAPDEDGEGADDTAGTVDSGGEPDADAGEPEPEPAPVRPSPRPRRPAPEPDPVETRRVTIGSVPLGAVVVVDGRELGTTPWSGLLADGTHTIELRHGDDRGTRSITIGALRPKRFVWKGGGTWQVFP